MNRGAVTLAFAVHPEALSGSGDGSGDGSDGGDAGGNAGGIGSGIGGGATAQPASVNDSASACAMPPRCNNFTRLPVRARPGCQ